MPTPAVNRTLLVEGTSGVGKSTLIDALVRRFVDDRPIRKVRTFLHLIQAHTYGPLAVDEDRGSLAAVDNIHHLETIVSMLEWYVTALHAESQIKFFAVIDTLHLTQCFRPGILRWEDVAGLDAQLTRIGVRIVFLHATADTIWHCGIVPRATEQFMLEYAQTRFGSTPTAVRDYLVDEQEQMQRLLARTRLPHWSLAAETDAEVNLGQAIQFWLS